jgi:hypothetical protein
LSHGTALRQGNKGRKEKRGNSRTICKVIKELQEKERKGKINLKGKYRAAYRAIRKGQFPDIGDTREMLCIKWFYKR